MNWINVKYIVLICFVHFSLSSCAFQSDGVLTSGFENGAEGWKLPSEAKIVKGQAFSGKSSLYFKNSSPGNYNVISRKLEVYPNEEIDISVQIKGKNISNSKNQSEGAGFYVESYDKNGTF